MEVLAMIMDDHPSSMSYTKITMEVWPMIQPTYIHIHTYMQHITSVEACICNGWSYIRKTGSIALVSNISADICKYVYVYVYMQVLKVVNISVVGMWPWNKDQVTVDRLQATVSKFCMYEWMDVRCTYGMPTYVCYLCMHACMCACMMSVQESTEKKRWVPRTVKPMLCMSERIPSIIGDYMLTCFWAPKNTRKPREISYVFLEGVKPICGGENVRSRARSRALQLSQLRPHETPRVVDLQWHGAVELLI
jgi:hypothetical protein